MPIRKNIPKEDKPGLQERTGSWEDLRTVLAIEQAGSLSGAARTLGVEHSTVFRRLEAIEHRLGVALFQRGRTGYAANAHGELMAEAARAMEEKALAAERRVLGADMRLTGSVRIATTEMFAAYLLPPALERFMARHPDIEVEVEIANRTVDLTRREADVALRATQKPPEHLVGRPVGEICYAIYASRDFARRHKGVPLEDQPWIGFDERIADFTVARWHREQFPSVRSRLRFDSLPAMLRACSLGLGVAVLPFFAANQQPSLTQLSDGVVGPRMPVWILSHRDLRQTARVRALTQHLAKVVPGVMKDLQRGTRRPAGRRRPS